MKIKVTYPIRVGEKLYQPGEVIEVKDKDGLLYVENEWAFEIADANKKAVKDGNRSISK